MARGLGNAWAHGAAGFTRLAHQRSPLMRWLIVAALAVAWAASGVYGWLLRGLPPSDAIYQTLAALFMAGNYGDAGQLGYVEQQVTRFAGVALTAVGLLFGFSGALGRAAARAMLRGAAGHVVIAGDSVAALSLARSCRAAKDAVVLIAPQIAPETAWGLRQSGVVLLEGDSAHIGVLRSARAGSAAHVVAIFNADTDNLQVEAALQTVLAGRRRTRPLAASISFDSPILLQEAREMRMLAEREKNAPHRAGMVPAAIDPRPFSLDEISARLLLRQRVALLLNHAARTRQPRPHLLLFGFDAAAEALAVRTLIGLWSARFGAPRVTVVTDDPEAAARRFDGRYPHARSHEVARADVDFQAFDWRLRSIDAQFLQSIQDQRGPVSFVAVSTGHDADNIVLGLGLLRACSQGALSDPSWRAPIFMKESGETEFSRQFAGASGLMGGEGASIEPFGGVEAIATRRSIIEGALDVGAALAHEMYQRGVTAREGKDRSKELEAMMRVWEDVPETYRGANRAVADHALLKMWDLGWTPAPPAPKGKPRTGQTVPAPTEREIAILAKVEHDRWVAERLFAGWRPGGARNNRFMIHPNLVPWEDLSENDRAKDADQVRASVLLASILQPNGFVRRDAPPLDA